MTRLVLFGGIALVLVWPVRALLVRASWAEQAPRAAIALWQAIAGAVGIALVSGCVEAVSLAAPATVPRRSVTDFRATTAAGHAHGGTPNELFALTAGLIVATLVVGGLLARTVGLLRARAHRRMLIDLVGQERADLPGTLVLLHPEATAFSLPGRHGRVVVSSGAIDQLAEDELGAVLAHERAHVKARHDLVLLPFRALCSALPRSRVLAAVRGDVAALVEMAADDRALRECDRGALERALRALARTDGAARAVRVRDRAMAQGAARARSPLGRRALLACTYMVGAGAVLAMPMVAMLAPLGGR